MALSKLRTMMADEGHSDLAQISWDLTVQGVVLTAVAYFARGAIDGSSVAIICGYLAIIFMMRLIFVGVAFQRYFWGRLLAIAISGLFAWWLLYQAENTRVGWYRFNFLQQRVQRFVSKAPAYVILADPNSKITCTSDNIDVLTGYTKQELVGQSTTILMRPSAVAGHLAAVKKATAVLRSHNTPNSGWVLQGVLTVGIKHKDGHIVPVRVYAGGIRWSQEITFEGDTDLFAVFVPVREDEVREGPTTIPASTPVQTAPSPPATPTLVPVPAETAAKPPVDN
jgi:PAS domain S-box-containing protein